MFNENELPTSGMRSGGVKSFAKLGKSHIVNVLAYPKDNSHGKVVLITDKACVRIYDVEKTELTARLGHSSSVFKSFKSDVHELVYAFKLNKEEEANKIRFLDNMQEVREIVVDDYHLTPMDRYAKQSVEMSAKIRLVTPFIESDEFVDDKIVSHYVPKEDIPEFKEETKSEEPSKEEVAEEEEKGYTQISIFDDDFLND